MKQKPLSSLDALLIGAMIIFFIGGAIWAFGADSLAGATQVALFFSAIFTGLIGLKNGISWDDIEDTIVATVGRAVMPLIIFLAVGCLIATMMLSGAVPTLLYVGLGLLSPTFFYPLACLLTALVALCTGSSWTTAATIGVALMGVAMGFDLSLPIAAGAVISGAYFGDKMSPLSETTNLASAMGGSDLFAHIRHMSWVSGPSFLISLVAFFAIGLMADLPENLGEQIANFQLAIANNINLNPINVLPVVALLYMSYKQIPALLAICTGVLLSVVITFITQLELLSATVNLIAGEGGSTIKTLWQVVYDGFQISSGVTELDDLLSRGGMESMVFMVWLVLCSMMLSATLKVTGFIEYVLNKILHVIRSTGSLIAATVGTSVTVNLLTGDQYLSIVLPGQMWKVEYEKRGLDPVNMTRTLEDGGTVTSPLVPWGACGVFMAGTLGVDTLAYFAFTFFCLLNPLIAILYGYMNIRIKRMDTATA